MVLKYLLLLLSIPVMTFSLAAQESSEQSKLALQPEAPQNCEENIFSMETFARITQEQTKDGGVLIAVARLGKGEKSREFNRRRLYNVREYLKDRAGIPPARVVVAEGERASGLGRIEFYLGGKMVGRLLVARNKDLCLICCDDYGPYYPQKDNTKPRANKFLRPGQGNAQLAARLVHRYERACGYSCLQELAIDLGGSPTAKPDDTVAIRYCSKESLPVAMATAAAPSEYLTSILTGSYGYIPERIILMRSEDCGGSDKQVTAMEFWAVPHGAAPPAHVDSVASSQVQSESVGAEAASTNGTANYNAAAQELAAKLRASPEATGIVLGYYYKKPSTSLPARLREVQTLLERSGLPQDRYTVRLMPWTGERSVDPPETEPKYPSLFVVKIMRGSGQK
jgi:hypothetical protein